MREKYLKQLEDYLEYAKSHGEFAMGNDTEERIVGAVMAMLGASEELLELYSRSPKAKGLDATSWELNDDKMNKFYIPRMTESRDERGLLEFVDRLKKNIFITNGNTYEYNNECNKVEEQISYQCRGKQQISVYGDGSEKFFIKKSNYATNPSDSYEEKFTLQRKDDLDMRFTQERTGSRKLYYDLERKDDKVEVTVSDIDDVRSANRVSYVQDAPEKLLDLGKYDINLNAKQLYTGGITLEELNAKLVQEGLLSSDLKR